MGWRVLVAPDSFKGTASPLVAARAMAAALGRLPEVTVVSCPLSDGGDGFLDVMATLGGTLRVEQVTGPLGDPVVARWLQRGDTAVVEAAAACGLVLAGGAVGNRPLTATSFGVGQLVVAALTSGARRLLVGVGGTATTDGGAAAVAAVEAAGLVDQVAGRVVVACDVRTVFADAAAVFAPQKGAGPADVAVLTERLHQVAEDLQQRFGRDPRPIPGSGAGGGLAGGLAALGAELRPGAEVVAEAVGLRRLLEEADLVVTGEGRFDDTSLSGKVVGSVLEHATAAAVPAVVVAGSLARRAHPAVVAWVDLSEQVGAAAARRDLHGALARTVPAAVMAALNGRRARGEDRLRPASGVEPPRDPTG
jgi:glycerate kinase